MTTIKSPPAMTQTSSSEVVGSSTSVNQSANASSAKPAQMGQTSSASAVPLMNPEMLAMAVKEYQKLRKKLNSPVLGGAAGLFTDSIAFPEELMDPNNPASESKYLHLLVALLGMKDFSVLFESEEQNKESAEQEAQEEQERNHQKKPK